jgi:non-specific serine/threonine protein kinase/serine/threonine-protein kinase
MEELRIVVDEKYGYNPKRVIGRGGYGIVYLGKELLDPTQKVAVKVIMYEKPLPLEGITGLSKSGTRELLPKGLHHQNIIAVLSYSLKELSTDLGTYTKTFTRFAIVIELCNKDLAAFCNEEMPSDEERLDIMHQIIEGLLHLHEKTIVHRDLKPGNILIQITPQRIIPKIADYGVARMLAGQNIILTHSHIGTRSWRAPELFSKDKDQYGYAVDIFSLAHMLLALLVSEPGHCDGCRELRMFKGERLILWCR